MIKSKKPHVLVTINEGRMVRDLLEHAFIQKMCDSGYQITILCPNPQALESMNRWNHQDVRWIRWVPPFEMGRLQKRAFYVRRLLGEKINKTAYQWMYQLEQFYDRSCDFTAIDLLKHLQPDIYLSTNMNRFDEEPFVRAARYLGIKTIGLVRSWDNVYKGLYSHPDRVLVWNSINQKEVIQLDAYSTNQVSIIGPIQFDSYFDPHVILEKKDFCKQLKLDPKKPILTLATIGQYFQFYDETYLPDYLMSLIQKKQIDPHTQLVIRLHPWSHYEQFARFLKYKNVRLSYIDRYVPAMSWLMFREDMIFMANLLKHSDAIVTAGSTVLLEACVFDTPVLMPVFHPVIPEFTKWFYHHAVLTKHYKHLVENKYVLLDEQPESFSKNLKYSLENRSYYQKERQAILNLYVPYCDGKSVDRLCEEVINY